MFGQMIPAEAQYLERNVALQSSAVMDSVVDLDWPATSTTDRIVEPVLVLLCCLASVGKMQHVWKNSLEMHFSNGWH